jgi:hypothetical protein
MFLAVNWRRVESSSCQHDCTFPASRAGEHALRARVGSALECSCFQSVPAEAMNRPDGARLHPMLLAT